MVNSRKVTVYELHDEIISCNFTWQKEDNVENQKDNISVSDEVFAILQGPDWANKARELLHNPKIWNSK